MIFFTLHQDFLVPQPAKAHEYRGGVLMETSEILNLIFSTLLSLVPHSYALLLSLPADF